VESSLSIFLCFFNRLTLISFENICQCIWECHKNIFVKFISFGAGRARREFGVVLGMTARERQRVRNVIEECFKVIEFGREDEGSEKQMNLGRFLITVDFLSEVNF
jgi:hypothetical protein